MERAQEKSITLAEPRRETTEALTIVGLSRRYGNHEVEAIPAQWTDFQAFQGTLGERPGVMIPDDLVFTSYWYGDPLLRLTYEG